MFVLLIKNKNHKEYAFSIKLFHRILKIAGMLLWIDTGQQPNTSHSWSLAPLTN